ncbi:MAG: ABC transporter permease, partial [Actinobacteria bacterium]|nr:ABC transporter permease [Actinomycetota bacterium]
MSDRVPGAGPEPDGVPPEQLPTVAGPLTGTPEPGASSVESPPRSNVFIRELLRGSVVTTILAVVLALVVGGVLIAITDAKVQEAAGYFFARPTDLLSAVWNSIYGAYEALFRGAIFNSRAQDFDGAIRPLTNTLGFAAPLIAAGLGIALAFRVGLFNIGARGQMLIGAATAALVSFNLDLPMWLHLPLTLAAGI